MKLGDSPPPHIHDVDIHAITDRGVQHGNKSAILLQILDPEVTPEW